MSESKATDAKSDTGATTNAIESKWSVKSIRQVIIIMSVILVVGIGYPWYLFTTTIHRAALPIDEINRIDQVINHDIKFNIPVYLNLTNASEDFIVRAQNYFDRQLYAQYPQLQDFWSVEFRRLGFSDGDIAAVQANDEYIINFKILPDGDSEEESFESFYVSPFSKTTNIELTNKVILSHKVEEFLTTVIMDKIFHNEIIKFNDAKLGNFHDDKFDGHTNIVFPYSSHYNLIFSLMVEDGKPINWQSDEIIQLLQPLLSHLNHFTNFTISTQIQYYSNLNIPIHNNGSTNLIIKEHDLSKFINYGDWNLNNNDINPTINFLLYFPKSNYEDKSLIIENSQTNAFLIPQWGGVHIYNKQFDVLNDANEFVIVQDELISVFEIFSSQLFQLLGLPLSLNNVNDNHYESGTKSLSIRIDSLTRLTIFNHFCQSIKILKSLIKLTNELNEISIPEITNLFTQQSILNLNQAIDNLESSNFTMSIAQSSKSLKNANKAFFEKDIVQQVYFPSEHKLAVFLPLVGPICSILFMSSIKQLKEWKNKK